jgi:adenylate cyclase class IV
MQIEIEKKFEFTQHDYELIKDNCEYIKKQDVHDVYYDNSSLTLFKQWHRVRTREWEFELKIKTFESWKSFEIDGDDNINQEIHKFGLKISDLKKVLEIVTNREKYSLEYKWSLFIVDIDLYKYGQRDEVELCLDSDTGIDGPALIYSFREHLWLTSPENIEVGKVWTCAMHENPELYEILLKEKRIKEKG